MYVLKEDTYQSCLSHFTASQHAKKTNNSYLTSPPPIMVFLSHEYFTWQKGRAIPQKDLNIASKTNFSCSCCKIEQYLYLAVVNLLDLCGIWISVPLFRMSLKYIKTFVFEIMFWIRKFWKCPRGLQNMSDMISILWISRYSFI